MKTNEFDNMHSELEKYFDRLWPICRSLTGNGVRESLSILSEIVPMLVHEIPSGTNVLDWTVPKEWNIQEAYIITPEGKKIADMSVNNLHIVSYSTPVDTNMEWEELAPHLHTLPSMPNAVPYITSYYKEKWGFCLSHHEWESLPRQGTYQVVIKSSLEDGHMTYGETVLPGETTEEVLFSTYICHPSMANNELSGPLAQAFLYRQLSKIKHRKYTYRFLFIPETIGAIACLATHGQRWRQELKAGFVLTCLGNAAPFQYKRSRRGNSIADRIVEHLLNHFEPHAIITDFAPNGSDERQYCSPGFNLPVGSLMRTPYYQYPYYHTSLDNKSFISFEALAKTVEMYVKIAEAIEVDDHYINTAPYGEPRLGKRNLYPETISAEYQRDYLDTLLFLINFSDGEHSLLDIAEKRGKPIFDFLDPLKKCLDCGLIVRRANRELK
jgi:aminopeptidase-like protein